VVEDSLGITNGFWGLVEQGVDVKLLDIKPSSCATEDRLPNILASISPI
jgi:hypothetical protein